MLLQFNNVTPTLFLLPGHFRDVVPEVPMRFVGYSAAISSAKLHLFRPAVQALQQIERNLMRFQVFDFQCYSLYFCYNLLLKNAHKGKRHQAVCVQIFPEKKARRDKSAAGSQNYRWGRRRGFLLFVLFRRRPQPAGTQG